MNSAAGLPYLIEMLCLMWWTQLVAKFVENISHKIVPSPYHEMKQKQILNTSDLAQHETDRQHHQNSLLNSGNTKGIHIYREITCQTCHKNLLCGSWTDINMSNTPSSPKLLLCFL